MLLSSSEVYTTLERGTIDAAEWVNPFLDERMGLYRAAKIYHFPGWQEPQSNMELTVNSKTWSSLPRDLQEIIRIAAGYINEWSLGKMNAENGPALERMQKEHRVQVLPYPPEVLEKLEKAAKEVIAELGAGDPLATKVYESYSKFRKENAAWKSIVDVS